LKVHTEDAALTRYLVRALKEARSPSMPLLPQPPDNSRRPSTRTNADASISMQFVFAPV
jgi:hypothetical protein